MSVKSFEDFKLYEGNYVVMNGNLPTGGFDLVYYHTTLAEIINDNGFSLNKGEVLVQITDLSPELQMKFRLALYLSEYGQTDSYLIAINNLLKDRIEQDFIRLITKIGMEIPENHEDIIQSIFEYILELPKDVYGDEDIMFGFQYWIENK